MNYTIENETLQVTISAYGAELQSIQNKSTKQEYLWEGRKEFWGRRAPVLFPFVGSLKDKRYIYEGREYSMGQHGFARDMEFTMVEQSEQSVSFRLTDTAETFARYPFHFELMIGYVLKDNGVQVHWNVKNPGEKPMYFSIGAHPAFNSSEVRYIHFANVNELKLSRIDMECGLIDETEILTIPRLADGSEGYLANVPELYAKDALVVENHQTQRVALCDREKKEIVALEFDAPLFGVWSPVSGKAPFICIEPWYGRCDAKDFAGNLTERKWGNTLAAQEEFDQSYTMWFA